MPDRSGDAERLLAFFRGTGTDDAGRYISEILSWEDSALEYHHDYIQWLFPLWLPSSVHPEAPILTDDVVEEFRGDEALRATLSRALERMLGFYGLQRRRMPDGTVIIEPGARFAERQRNWLRPYNHNHLRLTRILQCLATLGLEDDARALQQCLLDIAESHPGSITQETIAFWRWAV